MKEGGQGAKDLGARADSGTYQKALTIQTAKVTLYLL